MQSPTTDTDTERGERRERERSKQPDSKPTKVTQLHWGPACRCQHAHEPSSKVGDARLHCATGAGLGSHLPTRGGKDVRWHSEDTREVIGSTPVSQPSVVSAIAGVAVPLALLPPGGEPLPSFHQTPTLRPASLTPLRQGSSWRGEEDAGERGWRSWCAGG
jgi:hypothetical protein